MGMSRERALSALLFVSMVGNAFYFSSWQQLPGKNSQDLYISLNIDGKQQPSGAGIVRKFEYAGRAEFSQAEDQRGSWHRDGGAAPGPDAAHPASPPIDAQGAPERQSVASAPGWRRPAAESPSQRQLDAQPDQSQHTLPPHLQLPASGTAPRQSFDGPPLTSPAEEVLGIVDDSIVWSRLGPCRFARSLLEPMVPQGACRIPKCMLGRGGHRVLEQLLASPPLTDDHIARRMGCAPPSGGQTAGAEDGSEPLVSLVWTVHNNALMAAKALLCVFRTAHEVASAEFVVYDDGSTEDMSILTALVEAIRWEYGANVVTPRSPTGRAQGYTLANTDALRMARGKYAVLLNTDVCPLPGWLSLLVNTISNFPGAGIVGPMMVNPKGRVMEVGGSVFQKGHPYNRERDTMPSDLLFLHATTAAYISAACVIFQRQLFLDLGLFDPQFAPAYYEDTDAGLTMRAAGLLTVVQPLAVVVHAEGSSYSSAEKEQRMEANQQRFFQKHQAQLASHCPTPRGVCKSRSSVDRAVAYDTFMRQGTQVLVLDYAIPEPDRDSGSLRMYELLQILIDSGYGVSFQPWQTASLARYVLQLLALGVHVMEPGTLKAMAPTKASSAPCPWAAVIISRRTVYKGTIEHVRALCPSVPIVYDTVDLHYVRERRSVEVAHSTRDNTKVFLMDSFWDPLATPKEKLNALLKEGEDLEVGYMSKSDFVLVVSTEEQILASARVGADKVRLLTNIYRDPDRSRAAGMAGRVGGLFVGSMCHTPNLDASKFIMREIFSPDTYGTFPPGFMHFVWSGTTKCKALVGELLDEAKEHPLVTLHLDVSNDELEQLHSQVVFFLGALRVGAGVKGKLCQALLYGLPIIGSEAATEGMRMVDEENVLAASTPEDYRKQITRLMNDKELWHKIQSNGFDLVQHHFGRGNAKAVLEEIFGKLRVAPRVTAATAVRSPTGRSAASVWECQLSSVQLASARRLEGLPDAATDNSSDTPSMGQRLLGRRLQGRRQFSAAKEGADCVYREDSNSPIVLPTEVLRDQLLQDDAAVSQRQSKGAAARGTCPDSTTPTPEHPFIFSYVLHSKEQVIRPFFEKCAQDIGLAPAIPGYANLSAKCSLVWNAGTEAMESCKASDPNFWRASMYFGTFGPQQLSDRPATCFVMLRSPLNRAIAQYNADRLSQKFGGKEFTDLNADQLSIAMDEVGSGLYMTKYLGCEEQDCNSKNPHMVMQAGIRELQRCHVGIADQHRETTSYLMMLLPWFDPGNFKILDDDGGDTRADLKHFKSKFERQHLKSLLAGDDFLYEEALKMFRRQMRGAISCYTREKYMGEEADVSRELKKIVRRAIRKPDKERKRYSQCLERRKLCASHDVDQRSCHCSEFVDFRED